MSSDPRRGLPSASSMYRVAHCPGSVALSSALRQAHKVYELPNTDAAAGTRIHSYLALLHQGEYEAAEAALESRAELGIAQQCVELREEILNEWLRPTYGNDEQPVMEFVIEKRFWYRQGLWPRFSGQPDYVAIDRTNARALICNYKTGRKESQEAQDNLQLRSEIVLLKHNEPTLVEIWGVVIEPLVSWESVFVQYNQEALAEAENQILAIVDRASWEPDNRIAGPWCTYCPARTHCLTAAAYIESIPAPPAARLLVELPRGEPGTVLWRKIQTAQKLLGDLEKAYTEIIQKDPDALPGLILPERGKKRPTVPHPGSLKAALAEYLNESEIDHCATYHTSKIEEVLGLKLGISGKELERKFNELTKESIVIAYDRPFVRERTRKEREAVVKPAELKEEFAL